MDNTILYIILGLIAVAIPVILIFMTMKKVRNKRETSTEEKQRENKNPADITEQLKSVKEERIEKKGISKTKN